MAIRRPLLACLLTTTLVVPAFAHGGQYRGPGNVVPQPSSSGSSQSSGSGANNGGAPTAPTAGSSAPGTSTAASGPAIGAAGAARGMTPRGVQLDEDLGRWEFWWEFGKDPYLRLREAVHGGNVNEDQLFDRRLGAARFVAQRPTLADRRNQDDAAGYLALALGLLRDRATIGDVRDLLRASSRRPFVMLQCSRALGLIGDQAVTEMLCRELTDPEADLFRLSAAAAAIGQLGDRRSLEPLLMLLHDAKQMGLTRAFAAVALGSVCDKDLLPWNSVYATQTNYRAAVDTLTDGARGILDIL